jgi:hypothetical protein
MKTNIYKLLAILLLLSSCSSAKVAATEPSRQMTGQELKDSAIYKAIEYFTTNCYLFKEDSIFSVNFADSVFKKNIFVSVDRSKNNGISTKVIKGSLVEGEIRVGILGENNFKFYCTKDFTRTLPTRYVIKKGKLFYWRDKNYPITEELISVLRKNNLLEDYDMFPNGFDDSKKGADYYFCKNNLSIYKRVISRLAPGGYEPPKLKCKCAKTVVP